MISLLVRNVDGVAATGDPDNKLAVFPFRNAENLNPSKTNQLRGIIILKTLFSTNVLNYLLCHNVFRSESVTFSHLCLKLRLRNAENLNLSKTNQQDTKYYDDKSLFFNHS